MSLIRPDPPVFFFFNDTAPTEIYPLSLHDALPIRGRSYGAGSPAGPGPEGFASLSRPATAPGVLRDQRGGKVHLRGGTAARRQFQRHLDAVPRRAVRDRE